MISNDYWIQKEIEFVFNQIERIQYFLYRCKYWLYLSNEKKCEHCDFYLSDLIFTDVFGGTLITSDFPFKVKENQNGKVKILKSKSISANISDFNVIVNKIVEKLDELNFDEVSKQMFKVV